jgi:hypothetical protein
MSPTTKDAPKQTLPAGHPQAGYVSPDLSTHEGTGTLPPSEVEWHERRNDAREAEVEAVEEAEDKAAKAEVERQEKEAEARRKWEEEHPHPLIPPAFPGLKEDAPKNTGTSTAKASS